MYAITSSVSSISCAIARLRAGFRIFMGRRHRFFAFVQLAAAAAVIETSATVR
jgi:hypothetical protein